MNKMKKLFDLWLMAVLACGLSLGVASCKDDDDNTNGNNPEVDATETDEAVAALRWLVALTDTREITDDWASKTYEPTIGQASTQNELNRVKVVNDLEEAKIDFASLAGIDTEGLDAAKTVTDEGVGTLTWTPSPGGADNLATVDVSSPLLPRLRQIIYCTSEQTGKNGVIFDNVKGTAYYRFGDVVRHDDGYYWVCVRPCFEPDKGDSHWINIFNASASGGGMKIPDKYLQKKWDKKDKYGNASIVLPTKLPAEDKHTHNLSQLIQALLKPAAYEDTYNRHSYYALGGFSPQYNGRLFVERVANYWDEPTANGYTVWQILFNRTREQMKEFTELDFFNQGYSWGLFDGNKATIYYYQSTEYRASYKSIRKMTFDVTRGFDVRAFAGDPEASTNIQKELVQFYDGISDTGSAEKSGRWLIRYASGKDLAGSILAPSPYEPLPHTTDVYVYNKKTNKNVRTELETEDDIAKALPPHATRDVKLHYLLAQNGYYYAHADSCEADKTEPVAIVVAETSDLGYRTDNPVLETGKDYKYMLMALKQLDTDPFVTFGPKAHCCSQAKANHYLGIRDGLAMTEKLQGGCGQGHDHKPAKYAWNATLGISDERRQALNLSHGFLPSAGQIGVMLDYYYNYDKSYGREVFGNGDNAFDYSRIIDMLCETNKRKSVNGLGVYSFGSNMIASSTESEDGEDIVVLHFNDFEMSGLIKFYLKTKTEKIWNVTPFFLAK